MKKEIMGKLDGYERHEFMETITTAVRKSYMEGFRAGQAANPGASETDYERGLKDALEAVHMAMDMAPSEQAHLALQSVERAIEKRLVALSPVPQPLDRRQQIN